MKDVVIRVVRPQALSKSTVNAFLNPIVVDCPSLSLFARKQYPRKYYVILSRKQEISASEPKSECILIPVFVRGIAALTRLRRMWHHW